MMNHRQKWILVLLVVLALTGLYPYPAMVKAEGSQTINETSIPEGQPLLFHSNDENINKDVKIFPSSLFYLRFEINGHMTIMPAKSYLVGFSKRGGTYKKNHQYWEAWEEHGINDRGKNYDFLRHFLDDNGGSSVLIQDDEGGYEAYYNIGTKEVMFIRYDGVLYPSKAIFKEIDSFKLFFTQQASSFYRNTPKEYMKKDFPKDLFLSKTAITLEEYIELYKRCYVSAVWPTFFESAGENISALPTSVAADVAVSYAELTVGSRGEDVMKLKQRFLELGYYRSDKLSDRFTDSTAKTVRQFEKDHGLPVDGIADSEMLTLLYSPGLGKP